MSATASTTAGTTRVAGGVRVTPRPAMLTYARLDLRRQLRDRIGMFFVVGLPTFMYLVFGLGSDEPVGSGNVGDVRDDLDGRVRRRHRDHQRRRAAPRPSR